MVILGIKKKIQVFAFQREHYSCNYKKTYIFTHKAKKFLNCILYSTWFKSSLVSVQLTFQIGTLPTDQYEKQKKRIITLDKNSGLSLAMLVREPMQVMRLALLIWAEPWYLTNSSKTLLASSSSLRGRASFRDSGTSSRQKSLGWNNKSLPLICINSYIQLANRWTNWVHHYIIKSYISTVNTQHLWTFYLH